MLSISTATGTGVGALPLRAGCGAGIGVGVPRGLVRGLACRVCAFDGAPDGGPSDGFFFCGSPAKMSPVAPCSCTSSAL